MNNKWFTLIELLIVITISVILISIWFSKMWNFFSYENTISNVDNINKNFLKNKISSNYTSSEKIFYFSKNLPQFYYVYNNTYDKEKDFYIMSWVLNDNNLSLFIASDTILNQTWILNIENDNSVIKEELFFNSSWVTNRVVNIDIENINDYYLYFQDINNFNLTWKINIFQNSNDNSLFINRLIWTNFYNKELFLDYVKIINKKNWKNIINWFLNDKLYKIKNIKIIFKDLSNNSSFLEFY